MKSLPQIDETLLVRTDFSDETAWNEICAECADRSRDAGRPIDLYASLDESMAQALATEGVPLPHVVDDREYQAATTEELEELAAGVSQSPLMFIVDETAVSRPDHPILVVDLFQVPGPLLSHNSLAGVCNRQQPLHRQRGLETSPSSGLDDGVLRIERLIP